MAESEMNGDGDPVVWKMSFDLNTLEHLGVKLYTQYPPMIAELISNSWDADSNNVWIDLFDQGDKKIIVRDDGNGLLAAQRHLNLWFQRPVGGNFH